MKYDDLQDCGVSEWLPVGASTKIFFVDNSIFIMLSNLPTILLTLILCNM